MIVLRCYSLGIFCFFLRFCLSVLGLNSNIWSSDYIVLDDADSTFTWMLWKYKENYDTSYNSDYSIYRKSLWTILHC